MKPEAVTAVARMYLLRFSLVLFGLGFALPANAQRPVPAPEDLVLQPTAVVVRDLPPSGPPATGGRTKPLFVPDDEALHGTKQAFAPPHNQAPPGPNTLATPRTSAVTTTSNGLTGLRRSESGGWVPPDTQVAVGPNHVFEVVNLEGRIWNRMTSAATTFSLGSFFGLAGSNLSDPKIRYDATSERWFVAIISYNNSFTQGAWNLAVSTSGDPTGTFVRYTISTSRSAPDFPALAVNDDKIVLTANAFRANSFLGTEFLVINKANLVAGVSASASYFAPPQGLFTIQPAHALSTTCINASNCPLYMASVAFNSATSIQFWAVNGVPGVSTVTRSTVTLSIGTLTSPPDAKQYGTSTLIATNDNRLLEASYRDGILWVAANSACVPSGDTVTRACMRFIQFTISPAGVVTKAQDFDFGRFAFYYYYPAVQIDANHNLVGVFSGSSSATYAGVYASGQKVGDGPNTFQAPVLIKSGENSYNPFANRWGDYSGAAMDPNDALTVWVVGEYVDITGASEWGTWIAPVKMQ
jgi:hypothetical protein